MTAATAGDDPPICLHVARECYLPRGADGRPVVSDRAVRQWTTRGLNGHRLKTVRIGRRLFTRSSWFRQFMAEVASDTRDPIGTPGRPVPLDGKRRPTPKREDQMDLFDANDQLGRDVAAARAAVNPTAAPAPATDADIDAAARHTSRRMLHDDEFRKAVSAGPLGFGRELAKQIYERSTTGGTPAGEAITAGFDVLREKYAGDETGYLLASGACVGALEVKAGL